MYIEADCPACHKFTSVGLISTINPYNYICNSCGARFDSSWTEVQDLKDSIQKSYFYQRQENCKL